VSEACPPEELAALIEDDVARRILTLIHHEPMSANTLSKRCNTSKPTVYRRLEDLRRCNLLGEQTEPDPKRGHHRTLYTTTLERVVIELDDDGFSARVDRQERMADRFSRLIEEM